VLADDYARNLFPRHVPSQPIELSSFVPIGCRIALGVCLLATRSRNAPGVLFNDKRSH